MGRCYEFASHIVDGCDHAMTVNLDGSACECPSCGAHCTGRYDGCASILAQPGFVPVSAPQWAIERRTRPAAPLDEPRVAMLRDAPVSNPARRDNGVSDVQREDVLAVIADLRREIADLAGSVASTGLADQVAERTAQETSRAIDARMRELRTDLTWSVDEARRDLDDASKRQLAALDTLTTGLAEATQQAGTNQRALRAMVEGLTRVASRLNKIEQALGLR